MWMRNEMPENRVAIRMAGKLYTGRMHLTDACLPKPRQAFGIADHHNKYIVVDPEVRDKGRREQKKKRKQPSFVPPRLLYPFFCLVVEKAPVASPVQVNSSYPSLFCHERHSTKPGLSEAGNIMLPPWFLVLSRGYVSCQYQGNGGMSGA
ncbi:hypothetical protein VTL71DRAFT_7271 [Oculimacula yallundae]|uniref:Uncharacterized protein n=1 Tax=Oculimacula yallundae TaxID=86028 RepID=A0ABR4BWA4_9HELO